MESLIRRFRMESLSYTALRLMAKAILQQANAYKWSLQGLGMFRLYLSSELRMHVWDPGFAFPGASPMHTHPWDFNSCVVAGELTQTRFTQVGMDALGETRYGTAPYRRSLLLCGEGGCQMEEPSLIYLQEHRQESYGPGSWYSQRAEEIHWSRPEVGTVTLVFRTFREDLNRDHAYVFWPEGEEWGSAEPREAKHDEVQRMALTSLEKWFR
jgi:hypothetical protein